MITYRAQPFARAWGVAKIGRDGVPTTVECGMSRRAARTLAHRLNTRRVAYVRAGRGR